MSLELQSAYLTLIPTLKGALPAVRKELSTSGLPEEVAKNIDQGAGRGLIDGFKNALKGGAIALAATTAAGIGVIIAKGFQRLDGLDQATAKLRGLGHSAQSVEQIMSDALASVKGTAFGMSDAAQVAASVVAAGIEPGQELERTLKLVADAATIAGTDMSSMGQIFNKVAATGKIQGEVIQQLGERGIPILALLGEQLGVTAEEVSALASKGQIDFQTFQDAMEAGMGGAALESGNTFQGAMANSLAAAGRLGEALMQGIFPDMIEGFKSVIGWLDSMQPAFTEAGRIARNVLGGIKDTIKGIFDFVNNNKDWLGPIVIGIGAAVLAFNLWTGAIGLWRAVTQAATLIQAGFNAVLSANPIGLVVAAITALVAGLTWFFTQTEVGQEIWAGFTAGLVAAWDWVVGAFEATVGFFKGIFDAILGAFQIVVDGIRGAWQGVIDFFRGIFNGIIAGIEGGINFFIDAINWLIDGVNMVSGTLGDLIGQDWRIPHLERLSIPRLADGAIIDNVPGGVLANIGEGRYPEAVIPLGGPQFDRLAEALSERQEFDGPMTISGTMEIVGDGLVRIIDGRLQKQNHAAFVGGMR